MKRKFMLASVLLFMMLAPSAKAQISIDVTAIQRLVELKNMVDKAKKQLGELQKSNTINNGTRANTSAILETQVEIENLLRTADDFIRIAAKFNKLCDVSMYEEMAEFNQTSMSNYIQTLLWDQGQIQKVIEQEKLTDMSGMKLYDYIHTGKTAESQADVAHLGEYATYKTHTLNRIYGLQTAMQKRNMQRALEYYRMAEELEKKAYAITLAVTGEIRGTPLLVKNKGLFQTGSLSNPSVFDDPFSFDNLYSDNALGFVDQLFGGTGSSDKFNPMNYNPINLITKLFGSGKGKEEEQRLLAQMQAQETKDKLKQSMGSFQGQSGVNYPGLADGPLPGGTPFGTSANADGLRLTTGERIANQKSAIDLYVQAAELRQKGDALMLEAVVRTPEQKYVDAVRERLYQRKALATIKL